uniref:Lysine-specific metallo-endopeptidase domain-containing protein n=1 Tax=Amphimedon queenslandica TaxID=400682 RepID=A0A1X7UVI7_AMPQE
MKTFVSLLFCVACAVALDKGWPVSLDMSCEQSLSDVACTFEFLNVADEDYYLLKRNTPLEGLLSQFVAIYHKGRRLDYEGIFIHRTLPTKDEYILLKAGQKVSATVRINEAFTLINDGRYTVEYIRPLMVLNEMQMPIEVNAKAAAYMHLENARYLSLPSQDEVESEGSVTIESCTTASFTGGTSSKRTDILNAHKKLCKEYGDAKNNVSNSDFYKTWFGTYTDARATKVKKVCQDCVDGLTSKTVTYVIEPSNCQSNWNAYTYKGGTKVYLCQAYNNYQVYCKSNGDPTKEGILAHEWSHAFGYTDDYTYGASANKQLAKDDPDKAVKNADTYEYYYCLTQF